MIDLLLQLLEKLEKLAEYSSERKKRAFKELAEPMFDDLLEVHKNYLVIFTEARSLAGQNPDDPSQAIQYLEKMRTDLEPVRVKLAAMAQTIFQAGNISYMDELLRAVAGYFPVGDIVAGQGTASTSLIAELKWHFTAERQGEVGDDCFCEMAMYGGTNAPAEENRMACDLASRHFDGRGFQSPVELIDLFIALQQQKWKGVCEAFARVKSANLAA
jgi:hypothetical protein